MPAARRWVPVQRAPRRGSHAGAASSIRAQPAPSPLNSIDPGVTARLRADVTNTVGADFVVIVETLATALASLDMIDAETKLIEDVQQDLMDNFVNTCWPECPRHGSHPLWYREGSWWCDDKDQVAVAALGMLASISDP